MTETDIKTNLMLIALMGLAMFGLGTALYMVAHKISAYGHLLLPLPPIAVAAYIYVINWYTSTDAAMLKGPALLSKLWSVFIQTLVGGALFVTMTLLMLTGLIIWRAVTSGSD